jgi:hypothetical protein
LLPGNMTAFGFDSPWLPGQSVFLGFGSDPITGFPTGDLVIGSTIGPVAIPEPTCLILLGTGLVSLFHKRLH